MKNWLLFIALFHILSANAQTHSGRELRDNNGALIQTSSSKPTALLTNPNEERACFYKGLRPLSEINQQFLADAYPWISADGLRLYFCNEAFNDLLAFSERPDTNSYFGPVSMIEIPEYFGPAFPWLSSDELDLYLADRTTVYHSHRNSLSAPFSAPDTISLTGYDYSFVSGPSLNTAQDKLFLFGKHFDNDELMEYTRTSTNSFAFVRKIYLPTDYIPTPGQLSKDDLTLYLGASVNGISSSLYQLTRPSPNDTFAVETFELLPGTNDDNTFYVGQPTMSAGLEWLVFVKAAENSWSADELYIMRCDGSASPVFDPKTEKRTVSIFPNPASGIFQISSPATKTPRIEICNALGKAVYEKEYSSPSEKYEVNISDKPYGVYFVKLYDGVQLLAIEKLILGH